MGNMELDEGRGKRKGENMNSYLNVEVALSSAANIQRCSEYSLSPKRNYTWK